MKNNLTKLLSFLISIISFESFAVSSVDLNAEYNVIEYPSIRIRSDVPKNVVEHTKLAIKQCFVAFKKLYSIDFPQNNNDENNVRFAALIANSFGNENYRFDKFSSKIVVTPRLTSSFFEDGIHMVRLIQIDQMVDSCLHFLEINLPISKNPQRIKFEGLITSDYLTKNNSQEEIEAFEFFYGYWDELVLKLSSVKKTKMFFPSEIVKLRYQLAKDTSLKKIIIHSDKEVTRNLLNHKSKQIKKCLAKVIRLESFNSLLKNKRSYMNFRAKKSYDEKSSKRQYSTVLINYDNFFELDFYLLENEWDVKSCVSDISSQLLQ